MITATAATHSLSGAKLVHNSFAFLKGGGTDTGGFGKHPIKKSDVIRRVP